MARKRTAGTRSGTRSVKLGRRGIQSIGIGVIVLRALAAAKGPLHLREVAAAAQMSPSKAYRYLVSFASAGMVRQDPGTGRYDLGEFCSELGLAALGRISGLDIVSAELINVTSDIQRDAQIAVWTPRGPTVIRWMSGPADVAIKVREGIVLPLLTTATGRVWACYLPRELTQPLIEAELTQLEKEKGSSRQELRSYYDELVSSTKHFGLSRAEGERRPGIDALAGPVFDPAGLAFTITILGPHRDFDLSYEGVPARLLRQSLARASRQLGGLRDPAPAET